MEHEDLGILGHFHALDQAILDGLPLLGDEPDLLAIALANVLQDAPYITLALLISYRLNLKS